MTAGDNYTVQKAKAEAVAPEIVSTIRPMYCYAHICLYDCRHLAGTGANIAKDRFCTS